MVAVAFGKSGGVITASLFNLYHLRRTGFPTHAVCQSSADTVCGSARLQHFLHSALDVLEIIFFKRYGLRRIRIDSGDFSAAVIQQFFSKMRLINHAVIGQGCSGMSHL